MNGEGRPEGRPCSDHDPCLDSNGSPGCTCAAGAQLVLRNVAREKLEFEARFPAKTRLVSVLIRPFDATVEFPHIRFDSGLSLGCPELDRLVVDRAKEVLALRGRGRRRRRL
jgi:hypothetical protein